MRILGQLEGGAAAAERQLAAEMLNMEIGARAFGADGAPLAPPHAPWPLIAVPAATTAGVPYEVHYRPAVGVVYYTRPDRFSVQALVRRLVPLLEAAGAAHLQGYRAAAASPAAVLRYQGRARAGTTVKGPCDPPARLAREGAKIPARLMVFTPDTSTEAPRHWSVAAVFTWVFMPIEAALRASREGYSSMANVNALVAGLVFDAAGICGGDGPAARDVDLLTINELGLVPVPLGIDAAGVAGLCGRGSKGALVIGTTGRVTFAGSYRNLTANSATMTAQAVAALASEPWAHAMAASGDTLCALCRTPHGGEAAVVARQLTGSITPGPNQTHTPMRYNPNNNRPLQPPATATVLCRFCCPPCLAEHMGGALTRSMPPLTAAQACAASASHAALAPLLGSTARAVPGVVGAFILETPAHGTIIITGGHLGGFPTIAHPAVGRLRHPIIAQLNLIKDTAII